MGRPHRASLALTAPLDDLLTIVLRQFKRPLAVHGITMSDQDAHGIVRAALEREPLSEPAQIVREGLAALSRLLVDGATQATVARMDWKTAAKPRSN